MALFDAHRHRRRLGSSQYNPRYDYPLTQTRRAVKALLLLAAITFLVVTVVMAVVFRDQRSRNRLRFMRNVGWGYVIAILLLAAWRIYAGGL